MLTGMSSLARRPSRRQREQRAYLATTIGGGATAIAPIAAVLAIIGVIGWTLPIIAAVVAVVSWFVFKSAVGR